MTQAKHRAREGSRSKRVGRTSQRAGDGDCPSCGAVPPAGSNFCHRCGAALDGAAASRRHPGYASAPIYAVAVLSVVSVTLAAALLTRPHRGEPTAPPAENAVATMPSAAVDLSAMTPRQAADRLFNRVMSASERGDSGEATRFAPMAVSAYGRVAKLDADARYHLGLLYLVLEEFENARIQIDALKQAVPQHLLALLLEHELASRTGDAGTAARATAEFAAAHDAELAMARPEYEAHRSSIERFRSAAAAGQSGSVASARSEPAERGAQLYERRCAECHGEKGTGTDRGPPLVHSIYEPGHHGDAAFFRAVREGVRSHHWQFGDMPPVPGIPDDGIALIVDYVRALQKAKGIE